MSFKRAKFKAVFNLNLRPGMKTYPKYFFGREGGGGGGQFACKMNGYQFRLESSHNVSSVVISFLTGRGLQGWGFCNGFLKA